MDSENPNKNIIPSNTICCIQFFLILDNAGNRIYCKYYLNSNDNAELNSFENQKLFEKRLCEKILKSNVDRVDLDIINFENYNILCKVNREVNIFIGLKEDDNEILLEKIYDAFEMQLFDIVKDDLSREKIFKYYDKLIVLIDELIYGGLVLNIDMDSLTERIFEEKISYDKGYINKNIDKGKNGGNFLKSLFGF